MSRKWKVKVLAPLAALALVAAGCGSSSSSSSSSSGAAGGSSTSAAASSSSGSAGAGTIKLPHETIAYGEPAALDEVTQRNVHAVMTDAKALGWTVKYTDGQGDLNKMIAGTTAAINAGANAVLIGSTDANEVRPVLLAAKQKGIPAILIGGGVGPSPLYTAEYAEPEGLQGRLLAQKMVSDLHGNGQVLAMDITELNSGVQREQARNAVFKGTGVKVVADKYGDLANPVQGTQQAVAAMVAAHPNANALWIVYDYMMQPALDTLKQLGNKKIGVYTWFADPAKVALMRKNPQIKAYVEGNLDHTADIAMDQLANHFKNNVPVDPNAIAKCPLKTKIITRENAPPPGQLVWPVAAGIAKFTANWDKGEFGKGADCGPATS